jgi:hypothetical protein
MMQGPPTLHVEVAVRWSFKRASTAFGSIWPVRRRSQILAPCAFETFERRPLSRNFVEKLLDRGAGR